MLLDSIFLVLFSIHLFNRIMFFFRPWALLMERWCSIHGLWCIFTSRGGAVFLVVFVLFLRLVRFNSWTIWNFIWWGCSSAQLDFRLMEFPVGAWNLLILPLWLKIWRRCWWVEERGFLVLWVVPRIIWLREVVGLIWRVFHRYRSQSRLYFCSTPYDNNI